METIFLDSNDIANWILIIEALIETGDYYVKSSNLALAEVFHVVYNEVVSLKMYKLGIPLTLWSKLRTKHDLSKEEKFLVKEVVSRHLKTLRNHAEIVSDIVDDEIYPKLVLEYKLRTHDAVLLTTAILNECSWFITNDREIVDLEKRRKFSKIFGIVPDLPQNFLREVASK